MPQLPGPDPTRSCGGCSQSHCARRGAELLKGIGSSLGVSTIILTLEMTNLRLREKSQAQCHTLPKYTGEVWPQTHAVDLRKVMEMTFENIERTGVTDLGRGDPGTMSLAFRSLERLCGSKGHWGSSREEPGRQISV